MLIHDIKTHNRDGIEGFYKHYEIDQNHPIRPFIDRLAEPLELLPNSVNTDNENDISNQIE